MEIEKHDWFAGKIRSFKALKSSLDAVAGQFSELEAALVQHDNDLLSLEHQLKAKREELAEVDQEIRERKVMATKSQAEVQAHLQKRHVELVERESKVKFTENAAQEQLNKANALLAAAEIKAVGKRRPVEA